MWAYTDDEIDYLSSCRPSPALTTVAASARNQAAEPSPAQTLLTRPRMLPRWLKTWLRRQADTLALRGLDERSLADLGINRGDFPAILDGTYARGGELPSHRPDRGSSKL